MEQLRARARRKGIALERELREVLTAAAGGDHAGFRARAADFRQKLAGRRHSDSMKLLRQDRQR
jgi:plasmid stability protein